MRTNLEKTFSERRQNLYSNNYTILDNRFQQEHACRNSVSKDISPNILFVEYAKKKSNTTLLAEVALTYCRKFKISLKLILKARHYALPYKNIEYYCHVFLSNCS